MTSAWAISAPTASPISSLKYGNCHLSGASMTPSSDTNSDAITFLTSILLGQSTLVMVASYPPPGHSQRPEICLRSSLNLPLKLAGEPTSPPQIVKVSSPTSQTYSRATRPKGPDPSLLKK